MAILDMLGRPIEKGDVVVFMGGNIRPFNIANIEEGSLLGSPNQPPVGRMQAVCAFEVPLPNPNRTQNLTLRDCVIIQKGADLPAGGKQ